MAVHHGLMTKRTGDGSIIEFRSVVLISLKLPLMSPARNTKSLCRSLRPGVLRGAGNKSLPIDSTSLRLSFPCRRRYLSLEQ